MMVASRVMMVRDGENSLNLGFVLEVEWTESITRLAISLG